MAEGSGKPLNGKVVIVTGASSGIGKAIAIVLAEAGAKVAMAARREDLLKEIEVQIKSKGGVAISIKTDVTKREEVLALVQKTEETFGPVNILVNNAGIIFSTFMKNRHWDEWDAMIDVNIKGVTYCIGAVLEGMVKRKSGHIINISSEDGRKGMSGAAVYGGTKHYVEGLSQALRHEVCESGVKVTCVQPGFVDTDIFAFTTDKEAQEGYDIIGKMQVLKTEEIANAVLYAASQPDYVAVNDILIQPINTPL